MPTSEQPLEGEALIKEVCRRIRVARSYWDAHKNAACRQ
ncbi:MAG: Precorrin-3B methylase, partial [Cyanobacteria bacterium J06639_14]